MKTATNRSELLRKAEAKIASHQAAGDTSSNDMDTKRLLHELQVHQIELEMQNEELQRLIAELTASQVLNKKTLNSLPAHIAVIDSHGCIVDTNSAWTDFALKNDAAGSPAVAVGANYCDVCRTSVADYDADAAKALAGIEAVLDGVLGQFTMEYSCHSSQQQRWFFMTVLPHGTHHTSHITQHTTHTAKSARLSPTSTSLILNRPRMNCAVTLIACSQWKRN
ncbi:MAG: hypothetical protein WCP20_21880 [Desulfuromonadales bacterium]